MLNLALLVMKCNTKPGLPVLSAWISQDGHYAFVEFRSLEECNNGFQLSQIAIFGHVSKPVELIFYLASQDWKN
jgi:splicing factor U2AF subunit